MSGVAGRAGLSPGDGRRPRLRRRDGEVRRHDGLARADLRPRDELHPLLARPLQLRAADDGAARPRHRAHDGLRHRRPVGRRRQPLGDQVREGEADPRRERPRHRLRDDGRVPGVRQQRPAGGRHRGRPGEALHGQAAQAPDLPRRDPHAVGADHHLQRRLRQGHRQHAGRPPQGRALRAGREPDARPRLARLAGVVPVGRAPAVRRGAGRHQLHALGRAGGKPPGRQPRRSGAPSRAGHVLRAGRIPHEPQRPAARRRCSTRWTTRTSTRSSPSACRVTR